MKESTQVLLGLGAGLAAGIAISASPNPSLLSAADAVDAIPDLFATVTNATGDLAATAFVARFSPPPGL